MDIEFKDIVDAFDFVSFGQMFEHQAFLNKETGDVYCHTELGDDEEELPKDIDDDKYIEIPHKNDLNLGKPLVLAFAYGHLPNDVDEIEMIFRKKGAYSKFKDLIESRNLIDKWYEYESSAQEKALRGWCEESGIELHG